MDLKNLVAVGELSACILVTGRWGEKEVEFFTPNKRSYCKL